MELVKLQFSGRIQASLGLHYAILQPSTVPPGSGLGAILSLHGAGQRGSDLDLVVNHGLPLYARSQDRFPYLIIAPQCPAGDSWLLHLPELLAIVEVTCEQYGVDPSRIIITGYSMGGNGTWVLASRWPERFAAVVPICGWGDWLLDFPQAVHTMKNVPTWAFHGEEDDVIPVEDSEKLVSELRSVGGNIRWTSLQGIAHESWDTAYSDPALWKWLDECLS